MGPDTVGSHDFKSIGNHESVLMTVSNNARPGAHFWTSLCSSLYSLSILNLTMTSHTYSLTPSRVGPQKMQNPATC